MPHVLGILNVTEDSFSDGGSFLAKDAAVSHADFLLENGADVIDIGGVASNPDSIRVSVEQEISRLDPVIDALHGRGVAVSVDTFRPDVQRHVMAKGVAYLNDIHGFADAALHTEIARADCRLIVMHSIHGTGHVTRDDILSGDVRPLLEAFFADRLATFDAAGIARERLILDPGMGYFLGPRPEASFRALASMRWLQHRFDLPVLISVSRKSFLRNTAGRAEAKQAGPATLAAEIYAARAGADYIRTHDPGALRDAMRVFSAIDRQED